MLNIFFFYISPAIAHIEQWNCYKKEKEKNEILTLVILQNLLLQKVYK